MNNQLPIEGQKVEVKLENGDWQEAVYANQIYTDSYGLPLESDKIQEWRGAASNAQNAAGPAERSAAQPPESRAR